MTPLERRNMNEASHTMSIFRNSGLGIFLGEIQSDLSQMENLVGDAGALLLTGFTNINSLVRVQQSLAGELAAAREMAEAGTPPRQQHSIADRTDQSAVTQGSSFPLLLAQQAVIADQIEQEVNRIVRSLQFQDLTTQLLAHAKGRLAALESTLERIGEATGTGASWLVDGTGMTYGHEHKQRVAAKTTAEIILFPRSKPVVQHGMETGDVELF